jgi:7-cyano-7-deazaguanine reductase
LGEAQGDLEVACCFGPGMRGWFVARCATIFPLASAIAAVRGGARRLPRRPVAGANVFEVAFDDLGLVAGSVSAEVAAHRVDRLQARGPQERRSSAAVLLGERWAGEIHVRGHRAAYSTAMDGGTRSTEFVALGHPGSEHFAGLETFANPGVSQVDLTSDELVAVCPITGQPDLYVVSIEYSPKDLCLESKSLKLYLNSFRNEGVFCEALAVKIRDDVAEALGLDAGDVGVTLIQKARGGITITATA